MPDLLTQLKTRKILAILRGVPTVHASKLIDVLYDAGIRLFEVALSDEQGLPALKTIRETHPDLTLGAGTILTPELAAQAQEAGATFLVTPHLNPEVNAYARAQGLGLLCGAFSPTEIYAAYAQGTTAVKVFPAGSLGPDYFRQLHGPYPGLPLLAVGGVESATLGAYLKAGALGAGLGGALTRTDWNTPDWTALRRNAEEVVAIVNGEKADENHET